MSGRYGRRRRGGRTESVPARYMVERVGAGALWPAMRSLPCGLSDGGGADVPTGRAACLFVLCGMGTGSARPWHRLGAGGPDRFFSLLLALFVCGRLAVSALSCLLGGFAAFVFHVSLFVS